MEHREESEGYCSHVEDWIWEKNHKLDNLRKCWDVMEKALRRRYIMKEALEYLESPWFPHTSPNGMTRKKAIKLLKEGLPSNKKENDNNKEETRLPERVR